MNKEESLVQSETSCSRGNNNDDEDDEDDEESSSSSSLTRPFWRLPDAVLFHILRFVAPATHRATVVCHQWAPLSRDATHVLLRQETCTLWQILLCQDYRGDANFSQQSSSSSSLSSSFRSASAPTKRTSKRLRQSTFQGVQRAHKTARDNSEIAFYYLYEMVHGKSKQRGILTKAKLRGLFQEYGPVIRVNSLVTSGSLFLVELCRARHVREATLLACVKELVQVHGALVNGITYEAATSRQTALWVAATRGMTSIVRYLLEKGANPYAPVLCTGRVRYGPQQRLSLYRQDVSVLEFTKALRDAQAKVDMPRNVLSPFDSCLALLQQSTAPMAQV